MTLALIALGRSAGTWKDTEKMGANYAS